MIRHQKIKAITTKTIQTKIKRLPCSVSQKKTSCQLTDNLFFLSYLFAVGRAAILCFQQSILKTKRASRTLMPL